MRGVENVTGPTLFANTWRHQIYVLYASQRNDILFFRGHPPSRLGTVVTCRLYRVFIFPSVLPEYWSSWNFHVECMSDACRMYELRKNEPMQHHRSRAGRETISSYLIKLLISFWASPAEGTAPYCRHRTILCPFSSIPIGYVLIGARPFYDFDPVSHILPAQ